MCTHYLDSPAGDGTHYGKSLYGEGMAEPKKPKPKDERTQSQRFEDFAREHGATEDVLDKALRQPDVKQKPKKD